MNFLPDTGTLLAYSLASLILFITPGPDMSLFLSRTLASGRLAGMASGAGANLGCLVHTMLAAFGISALIAASEMGFLALKMVGAAYLLWLAVDALRRGSALSVTDLGPRRSSLMSSFLMGVAVNLTNPKVVLFFITFLPQFVAASDPHVTAKLLFLGLWFIVINLPLTFLLVWTASAFVGWLRQRPKMLRAIDCGFAAVFALFAIRIAFIQSR